MRVKQLVIRVITMINYIDIENDSTSRTIYNNVVWCLVGNVWIPKSKHHSIDLLYMILVGYVNLPFSPFCLFIHLFESLNLKMVYFCSLPTQVGDFFYIHKLGRRRPVLAKRPGGRQFSCRKPGLSVPLARDFGKCRTPIRPGFRRSNANL